MKLLLKEAHAYDSTYRAPVPTTTAARQLITTTTSQSKPVPTTPAVEKKKW